MSLKHGGTLTLGTGIGPCDVVPVVQCGRVRSIVLVVLLVRFACAMSASLVVESIGRETVDL